MNINCGDAISYTNQSRKDSGFREHLKDDTPVFPPVLTVKNNSQ